MVQVLLAVGSLVVLYLIIRTAVHHGIRDADHDRTVAAKAQSLKQSLQASKDADRPTD